MLANTLAQRSRATTEAIGYNVIITDAEGMVIGSGTPRGSAASTRRRSR
jgi:sugar diacid utilization regulator